jgi:hypothetical protein
MKKFKGLELSRALDKILVTAKDESLVRLLKSLRAIEMAHTEHETDTVIITETKRRVAEVRVHVSITKELTFKTCCGYFNELCALGFSTPGRKLTYSLILACYAERCGCNAAGARLIEPFVKRWKKTGERLDGFSVGMMREAAELLSELQDT